MPLGIELHCRGVHPKSLRGLFHGKGIQHGFQCADWGKRPRTKRDWKPNVQYKYLYSEVLQRQIKLFVTSHALKCIDRAGGLDMYLMTQPAASHGSIVASELRKEILKAYKKTGLEVPKKEGPTSILSIVNERLRDAGLRPACGKPANTNPKAPTSSAQPADAVYPIEAQKDARNQRWQPTIPIPHKEEEYRSRSRLKGAVVDEILKKKGFGLETYAGHQDAVRHARRMAFLTVKRMNRNELIKKIPKHRRQGVLQHIQRTRASRGRMFPSRSHLAAKRINLCTMEAVRKGRITHRAKIKRRNGLVTTNRGQATNEMLQRIVADPKAPHLLRFAWLQDFIADMPDSPGREAWRAVAQKYQPTVPGMLVGSTFVPATNRHAVGTLYEQFSVVPRLPEASEIYSACTATKEDILTAANAVAFKPQEASDASGSQIGDSDKTVPGRRREKWWHAGHGGGVVGAYLSHGTLRGVGLEDWIREMQDGQEVKSCEQKEKPRDVTIRMGRGVGRKFRKMKKWLSDDWLKEHVVPMTRFERVRPDYIRGRLVLGNGMLLHTKVGALRSRRTVQQARVQHRGGSEEGKAEGGAQ